MHLVGQPILAKKDLSKQVIRHFFQANTVFLLLVFEGIICVLHHLAFLVWLPAHIFFKPNYALLATKTPLLMDVLSCLALLLMV